MEPSMKLCQLIHMLERSKPSLRGLPVGVFCSSYYSYGFSSILIEPYTDSDEGTSGIAITFVGSQDKKPLNLQATIALLKVHSCFFGERVLKVEHANGMTKFGPTILKEVRRDPDKEVVDLIFS